MNESGVPQSEEADSRGPSWRVYLTRILDELGLSTLFRSSLDTKLFVLQRFARLFAYGATTLILVAYLTALGNSAASIGGFMTATLAGDVGISLVLTLYADRWGRRAILALGAFLMVVSGIIFARTDSFVVLLLAAILGVISPSGNEIGPFRAIEESAIAHITPPDARSDVYAWYSLAGNAGTASGMLACGWAIRRLRNGGWEIIDAYRFIFYAYAILGAVKLTLVCCLSKAVEAEKVTPAQPSSGTESEPLLGTQSADQEAQPQRQPWWQKLLPSLSSDMRAITLQLCLLFALDAFASGLANLSWVTYFFKSKFGLDESILGTLFSVASIVSAISVLVASSVSKRLGNVKTMVFTHLPSSIALATLPLPPTKEPSMALLLLRACTQSMDVAPRSAFLAQVITPSDRTAVMGIINIVKTASQSLGPTVTGALVTKHLFWLAFVLAGSLKVVYDLAILVVFAGSSARET